MMEWIITILLVALVGMGFYNRRLSIMLREEERDACRLSRELEQEQLKVYDSLRSIDNVQRIYNAVFAVISKQLHINLDIVQGHMWVVDETSDYIDTSLLKEAIAARVQEIIATAEAGNRAELVRKLSDMFKAMQLEDITFTEFLRELETIPSATYNRIAVHVLRQQR